MSGGALCHILNFASIICSESGVKICRGKTNSFVRFSSRYNIMVIQILT